MSNMVVRTNIFSLNAHRNLKNVGLEQVRASRRLSSGYRVNSAADDAAGLAISETMRAQIRGLDQASRNSQDAQALVMTTEGGLQEITNMVQRARELTVQAANDTNVDLNRNQIAYEIGHLAMEIAQMQTRVEFNTRQTLNMDENSDSQGNLHFQIGANSNQSLFHDFSNIRNAITDAVDVVTILAGSLGMVIDTSPDPVTGLNIFDRLDNHNRIGPPPRPVGDFPGQTWGTTWSEVMNFLPTVDRDQIALMAAAQANEASIFSDTMNSLVEHKRTIAEAKARVLNDPAFSGASAAAIRAAVDNIAGVSAARAAISAALTSAIANSGTAAQAAYDRLNGAGFPLTVPGATAAAAHSAALSQIREAISAAQAIVAGATAGLSASQRNDLEMHLQNITRQINSNLGIQNPHQLGQDERIELDNALALAIAARDAISNSATVVQHVSDINRADDAWRAAENRTGLELASAQTNGVLRNLVAGAATAEAADAAAARRQRETMAAAGGQWLVTDPAQSIIGTTSNHLVADARVLSAMLEPVQDILDSINIERAQLGALVNRLDFTMRSLDISSENLSDSESRIRNADMAREMMRFTSAQVLQQAGVSMLSHANNMPNNLLQLLN